MARRRTQGWISPTVLAISFVGLLATVWGALRYAPAWRVPELDGFVGWVCALFLFGTIVTIFWAATAAKSAGAVSARRFLGYALLTDCSGVLLLAVGVASGQLGFAAALRVYVVLMMWLGLCTSVALALRSVGSVFAVVAGLILALCCFAAPWTAVPLGDAVAESIPHSRYWVNQTIATATPMLAVTSAAKSDVAIDWGRLADRYCPWAKDRSLENSALPTTKWWLSAAIYGGIGGTLSLLRRPWRREA